LTIGLLYSMARNIPGRLIQCKQKAKSDGCLAMTGRFVGPQDVPATMYQVLGINYGHEFMDGGQQPILILNEGRPIQELL
jgi:hypothetical protein